MNMWPPKNKQTLSRGHTNHTRNNVHLLQNFFRHNSFDSRIISYNLRQEIIRHFKSVIETASRENMWNSNNSLGNEIRLIFPIFFTALTQTFNPKLLKPHWLYTIINFKLFTLYSCFWFPLLPYFLVANKRLPNRQWSQKIAFISNLLI